MEHAGSDTANAKAMTNENIDSELETLRNLVRTKNSELYKIQLQVLQNNFEATGSEEQEATATKCQAAEDEINDLVAQIRELKDLKAKNKLERQAELHADSMVWELRSSIDRGDFKQFKTWQNTKKKELHLLETELEEARSRGSGMQDIFRRLESCHAELEQMVEHVRNREAAVASSDSESDADLEYEQVQELEIGNLIKLICEDEDGFSTGDEGIIVEVDTSVAYPYRVKSLSREAHGYFKACDLEVLPKTESPVRLRPSVSLSTTEHDEALHRPVSPYVDRSRKDFHDIDLEKGLCKISATSEHTQNTFSKALLSKMLLNPHKFDVTLNPLAVVC